jgi:hypothetical protein
MMRLVPVHGVLLAAGLVAAYFTWTRDQTTRAEDEIQILNLRGSLDRVVYTSEDRTVEIGQRKDEWGPYTWVRVETWETPPPPPSAHPLRPPSPHPGRPGASGGPSAPPVPGKAIPVKNAIPPKKAEPAKSTTLNQDPKAAPEKKPLERRPAPETKNATATPTAPGAPAGETKPAPTTTPGAPALGPAPDTKLEPAVAAAPKVEPPKPAKVRKVHQFKGSKSVEELMKSLASLSAVRALGQVDAEKLKAFGLADRKKSLTLVSGSSPRIFYIGGNTYGNMDTYVQDKEDGRVFVVHQRLLQDFLYAEFRLVDRVLNTFEPRDVERAAITAKGSTKTLVQQNRRLASSAYWADEASPEKRKDFYRNWMSKVLSLRVAEYTEPDKKLDGLEEVVSLVYWNGPKKIGFLKLFKKAALIPKVAGSTEEGAGDYYALTDTTRAYVKLSRPSGDELARDVASLMKE